MKVLSLLSFVCPLIVLVGLITVAVIVRSCSGSSLPCLTVLALLDLLLQVVVDPPGPETSMASRAPSSLSLILSRQIEARSALSDAMLLSAKIALPSADRRKEDGPELHRRLAQPLERCEPRVRGARPS